MVKRDPKSVTFRLSAEARSILADLAESQGISKTAVIELLLRKEAKAAPNPPESPDS